MAKIISAPVVLPRYVGKSAVAAALGISTKTLDGLISRGEFPPGVKIGERLRWSVTEIEAHMANLKSEREASP